MMRANGARGECRNLPSGGHVRRAPDSLIGVRAANGRVGDNGAYGIVGALETEEPGTCRRHRARSRGGSGAIEGGGRLRAAIKIERARKMRKEFNA
jgi:hypothetical protein